MKNLLITIIAIVVTISTYGQDQLSLARAIEISLQNNFDVTCKRNLDQYQTKNLSDINIPFHSIECKHYKEGNWLKPEWWRQVCESASNEGTIPILIFKFNRIPTRVAIPFYAINPEWEVDNQKMAIMSMDDWLDILLKNWSTYEQMYQ